MQFNARRNQVTLLLCLLSLSGFTSFAWAYRASEQARLNQPVLTGQSSAKMASPRARARATLTSAAAVTHAESLLDAAGEAAALAPAQSGGSYNLTQSVIPGGGGTSANGNTSLTGTLGQSVAGASSAGQYAVSSGFWGGGAQCPVITLSPTTLPNGQLGAAYNQTLTGGGGIGPYSFAVSGGALPNNLTLFTTGVLSGTATQAGTFNFTVTATDANGCPGALAYTLLIGNCTTINLSPATLSNGTVGAAYSQMLTASGGTPAYNFSVSSGTLPNGLTLSVGGSLSGTPTTVGTFNFTVQATDTNNCTGTRPYTVVIGGGGSTGLQFYPLPRPIRLLETRPGELGCDAPGLPIPGNSARTQTAAGRTCDGITIPLAARALTGNITTVQSGGGFLTLYPSDAAQPLVANSNYLPNEVLNNVFTVGLGAGDGAFKIFVTSTTHVVVDVTGYYAPPGAGGLYFHPLPKPIRLLETRAGELGCNTPGVPIQGGVDTPRQARLTCDGVTIPAAALAVVGNATVVNPGGGFLTLWPGDATRPLIASSNYSPGQIMNAPFTVGLSPAGVFNIFATSTTDLVIDVLGYYSAEVLDQNGAGLLFNPLPRPVRLLETRVNQPVGCNLPGAPIQGGMEQTQIARGVCDGVTIANSALAIVGNATVVNPGGGFLTCWPSDAVRPLVATSNFTAGQVFNRHFTVGLGQANGAFKIFASLVTDLVIDVSGYFAP